jgi:hypothetical protein
MALHLGQLKTEQPYIMYVSLTGFDWANTKLWSLSDSAEYKRNIVLY